MTHTIRLAALVAAVVLLASGPADARHRRVRSHHRTFGHHRGVGYHCPLGEYWRPSLRICQGRPYRGEASVAAPAALAANAPSGGRRVVDTSTQVVSRRRSVDRDGETLRYVVVTRVTERVPRRAR